MTDQNDTQTQVVLPDNSLLLQIQVNGVMLPPRILPLSAIGQLPLIADAQVSTAQAIMLEMSRKQEDEP